MHSARFYFLEIRLKENGVKTAIYWLDNRKGIYMRFCIKYIKNKKSKKKSNLLYTNYVNCEIIYSI